MTLLSDFAVIRPTYTSLQENTLQWLYAAHLEAEKWKKEKDPSFSEKILAENLDRVSCKPSSLATRGHMLPDYLHTRWEEMEVYNVRKSPEAAPLSVRSALFEKYTDELFSQYYPSPDSPPNDLIHVTCTGYVSPSGAQKIVSRNYWGSHTTVTHAYHMGCNAAIPAIRMGMGFLQAFPNKHRADIVHTEVCSLHTHPADHRLDQLVCQSLFADGFIRYSIKKQTEKSHFRILSVHEELVSGSIGSMLWKVGSFGFEMTLLKEVPVFLVRAINAFLETLCKQTGKSSQFFKENALFAIHPGGPKILSYLQKELGLQDEQMEKSLSVFKKYGNMSSATIPHVWEEILRDENISDNTPVVSFAFGPGLNIVGIIMEKVCGSGV